MKKNSRKYYINGSKASGRSTENLGYTRESYSAKS